MSGCRKDEQSGYSTEKISVSDLQLLQPPIFIPCLLQLPLRIHCIDPSSRWSLHSGSNCPNTYSLPSHGHGPKRHGRATSILAHPRPISKHTKSNTSDRFSGSSSPRHISQEGQVTLCRRNTRYASLNSFIIRQLAHPTMTPSNT